MKKIAITIISLFLSANTYSIADDPFSRSFTEEITKSSSIDTFASVASYDDPSSSVHPIIRYEISKYIVKGTIFAEQGSIAIVSIPGLNDSVLFLGDTLGNQSHIISDIGIDSITASKKIDEDSDETEDFIIQVDNPMVGIE